VLLALARSGCAVVAGCALPMLVALAPATAATTCARGSGPHLAGQRITAAEVARYQGTTGLQCADFARANLSGLDLVQVDLTRANLRGANLSHTRLVQSTLTGAAMQGANLRKADLSQASMARVNLAGADLRRATLDQATLTDADLASADLAGASLIEVQANRANFRSANLSDVSFSGATLTGAHFTGANLSGADFSGATGAPATANNSGQNGGAPQSHPTTTTITGPTVSKSTWHMYLLGGVALLLVLMVLGSVRRFFNLQRVRGFTGTPGVGYQGGYAGAAPGGFGGYGGDASGFGGSYPPTTPGGPFNTVPGYMRMPSQFAGRMGPSRPGRLVVAIVGAFVVAIGLWLLGNGVLDAVLVPAGNAGYRLCETSCGSRISTDMVSLVTGVALFVFGGILRAVGRIRY
jgi:hypothetical protein